MVLVTQPVLTLQSLHLCEVCVIIFVAISYAMKGSPSVKIRVFFYLEVQQGTVLPGQLTTPGHEDFGKYIQHLTILPRFPGRILSLLTHAGTAQDCFRSSNVHSTCNRYQMCKRSQYTNTVVVKKKLNKRLVRANSYLVQPGSDIAVTLHICDHCCSYRGGRRPAVKIPVFLLFQMSSRTRCCQGTMSLWIWVNMECIHNDYYNQKS